MAYRNTDLLNEYVPNRITISPGKYLTQEDNMSNISENDGSGNNDSESVTWEVGQMSSDAIQEQIAKLKAEAKKRKLVLDDKENNSSVNRSKPGRPLKIAKPNQGT